MSSSTTPKPILENNLAYYQFGKSGRPVILLHGIRNESLRALPLINYLAPNHRVFAIDLPGYGRSPALKIPHTIHNLSLSVTSWINSHMKHSDYILAGASLGGAVAVESLSSLKHQPKNLVTIMTPFHYSIFKLNLQHRLFKDAILYTPAQAPFTTIFQYVIDHPHLLKPFYYLTGRHLHDSQALNYSIKQWHNQSAQTFLETSKDLLKINLTDIPPSPLHHFHFFSDHEPYFDNQKNQTYIKQVLPNTTFYPLNFTSHGPRAEVTPDLITPFKKIINTIAST